ncbi:MAG: ATP-binding protein [Bacilli bacterium]|nr:ATP-binding protein [Bacilli bacterium]
MRKLILMAGVAGSGKSTWAKKYASEHPNTYIIDTDETRKALTGSYLIFTNPVSVAWDEMIRQANEIMARESDCTVIMDSTFLDDERRMYYLKRLKGYDYLEHFMVKFHDYSVVYQNNKSRIKEKWVPEDVIKDMVERYVNPSPEVEKLFDKLTIEYWN